MPWWSLAAAGLLLGIFLPAKKARAVQVSAAAALAWAILAYILDGRSHGLISQRMSGLFGMPSPWLMFLLMALIGAVTALLNYQAGVFIRRIVDLK
jgi:hypothetical protein